MNMVKVDSSNIKEVGYEGKTLFVKYNSGLYAYLDVPMEKFIDLLNASSKGQFLNEQIKNNYTYSRIE